MYPTHSQETVGKFLKFIWYIQLCLLVHPDSSYGQSVLEHVKLQEHMHVY